MIDNREITVALVQMQVDAHSKEENLRSAESAIDEAVKEHNAELIVLPEFFTTVYFPQWIDRKYFALAEKIPGPSTQRIASKAREHKVHVIAPIYEIVQPGEYYDSSALMCPDGQVVSVHRKVHRDDTWYPEGGVCDYEKFYYRGGNQLDVVDIGRCKLGQLICYDRHFPEAWRVLALKGAELVVVTSAVTGRFLQEMFVLEGRIMAFMNQVFVAVVNRVGREGDLNFFGGSYIAAPDGRIMIGPGGTDPVILPATLNLSEIQSAREKFQLYRDRRPDVYGVVSRSLPLSSTHNIQHS